METISTPHSEVKKSKAIDKSLYFQCLELIIKHYKGLSICLIQ